MPIAPTELFSALADPTRRAIFERLARDGEQTVRVLTGHSGVSQPAVSKHLAVLKLAGLVLDRRDGRRTHYFGRRGGDGDQDHRHLDADAGERRHPCAHGAVGLPAGARRQLPGRELRLAEIFRRPGAGGGGRAMKTVLVSRHHPLLATLHWLLAVLIIAMLCIGFLVLAPMPSIDPQKIGILHMSIGMAILALMVARIIVRMRTSRPADVTTGYPRLDRLAPIIHYGFYALVLLMVGSGYATAILAGLNKSVFQGSGDPLPPDFSIYPTFVAHGTLAALLAGFIVLHLLAALFHQFVLKDGLLSRMLFGRRGPASSAQAK
jgi:cytochrome b561/DNA-binding transcriptional ArsR family regulator